MSPRHNRTIQVYRNKKADGPAWVVAEVIELGEEADPETTSDQWVDQRLEQAVGEPQAHRIRLDGYVRWELRVDPSGDVDKRVVSTVDE